MKIKIDQKGSKAKPVDDELQTFLKNYFYKWICLKMSAGHE